jgi:NADPH:quinone reductase-like Zn-dependent oxidoreductase
MKHAREAAIVASVAAVTLVGGFSVASSAGSVGVAAIHLYERSGPTIFVNNAQKGKKLGPGGVVVYANPVFDRYGKRVGTDHAICTVLSTTQSQCDATLALPKGQIVTHGLEGSKSRFEVAVIGGTGFYAGARGTMTATSIKGGRSTLSISLF